MRKWGLVGAILLMIGNAAPGEDCTLGERYATLAEKSKAAYEDHDAFDFLNHAVKACPRFEYWIRLGEIAMSLADPEASKRAGDAFVEAYGVATTPEERATSAAKYAQLLLSNGDPQRAINYALYAKNLTPSVSWIDELTDRISLRVAQNKPDDIRRGLGDVMFRPLRLADARPTKVKAVSGLPRPDPVLAVDTPAVNIPINFLYNSTDVDAQTAQNVEILAHVLAEASFANKRFTFVGHSDLRGEEDYNRILSLRRAMALKNQVAALEPSLVGRIDTVGRGKDQPLSWGPSEEDQRINRRLQVIRQ